MFVKGWAENLFSGGIHVVLVKSQEQSAPNAYGINPVRFYIETGRFGGALAPGASNI